jgi:hypothetical protein
MFKLYMCMMWWAVNVALLIGNATHTHKHTRAYAAFFNVCKGPEWWRKLAAVHQLLCPFIDAIQALEADKALLSQVNLVVAFHNSRSCLKETH